MKRYQILGLALLVLAGMGPPVYAGRDDWRFGRNGDRNFRSGDRDRDRDRRDCDRRHRRCNNWCDEWTFSSDYLPNNWNYLNAPPWYRLNYYTPWMSDYRDGTAWSKIPTSHAAEMYGMPSSYNTMPSGYYAWLAANGNGCAGVNTGYPGNLPQAFPPAPQSPININPGTYPGGNDVVQPTSPLGPGMDIVVVVQRELRKRGFYQGVITGVSDPSTRAAIRAYEARAGLPSTGGVIGLDLLRSLGLM